MGEFNLHICDSDFVTELSKYDIDLERQYQKLYQKEAPFSHMSGKNPTKGVFVTP